MLKYSFLCLTFFITLNLQAQNQRKIDSLNTVYQTASHDTTKILALANIAFEYYTINPDTCITLSNQVLVKSEKANFKWGIAKSYNNMGAVYLFKGNYSLALEYFQRTLKVYEEMNHQLGIVNSLGNIGMTHSSRSEYSLALEYYQKELKIRENIGNKEKIANTFNNIGVVYYQQGDYNMTIKCFEKSLQYRKDINDIKGMATNLNNLGILHSSQGNYSLALQYYQEALELSKKMGDKENMAHSFSSMAEIYQEKGNYPMALAYYQKNLKIMQKLGNKKSIGTSFNNIGVVYDKQGSSDLALEYYKKSLNIYEEIDDKKSLSSILNNIGILYDKKEDYLLRLEYLYKSLKIREEVGDKNGIAVSLVNIADTHRRMGDYVIAIEYQQKALALFEELERKINIADVLNALSVTNRELEEYDKSLEYAEKGLKIAKEIEALAEIKLLSNTLFETYKLKGDYEKALEYHQLYKESNDSLFNVEKSKAIANLESTLEIERKEKEIEVLNKDQELAKEKQAILQKDLQLQSIEVAYQKSAKLAIEKQAEADQLFALAKEAQSQKKADSLYRAAQNAQLEADNLKINAQKVEAENRATKAESEQKVAFQRNLSLLFGIGILAALIIAYVAYRNQRNKQKANLLLAEKNDEINHQNDLLAKSNQTKDKLFSIIAHDLRSPIASFQGINDQISFFLQKNKPERLLQMSDSIDSSARNLNHLLNNLLNWALTQTNQISIQKKEINLFENIEEALKVYQMNALIHQVELKNTVLKDVVVYVDKDSFQTILRNLIGNAIKYTPENGKITVSAQPQKDKVLLSVTDTGIGINEEDKQKLFELGVGNTNRGIRGEKGTGLGLVLCYEFAALNKIGINVESQPNEGTAFNLSIPTKS